MMRYVFPAIIVTTLGLYLTMLLWSLPALTHMAFGLPMFDMRPTGYTFEQAIAILVSLGPQGKAFYLQTQHLLDTAYPPLMACVLSLSYMRLFNRRNALLFSTMAVMAAGFDLLENAAVAVMLRAGPELVTVDMAKAANQWTLLKSATVSFLMIVLVSGMAQAGWRKWQNRQSPP